jgi:hypothetical protein
MNQHPSQTLALRGAMTPEGRRVHAEKIAAMHNAGVRAKKAAAAALLPVNHGGAESSAKGEHRYD